MSDDLILIYIWDFRNYTSEGRNIFCNEFPGIIFKWELLPYIYHVELKKIYVVVQLYILFI